MEWLTFSLQHGYKRCQLSTQPLLKARNSDVHLLSINPEDRLITGDRKVSTNGQYKTYRPTVDTTGIDKNVGGFLICTNHI